MGLRASVERLDDDDLNRDELSMRVRFNVHRASDCEKPVLYVVLKMSVMVVRTFFPAYLPRVMMATRPTLRTTQSSSASVVHDIYPPSQLTLHRCCRRSMGVVVDNLVFEAVKFRCGRVSQPFPSKLQDWSV